MSLDNVLGFGNSSENMLGTLGVLNGTGYIGLNIKPGYLARQVQSPFANTSVQNVFGRQIDGISTYMGIPGTYVSTTSNYPIGSSSYGSSNTEALRPLYDQAKELQRQDDEKAKTARLAAAAKPKEVPMTSSTFVPPPRYEHKKPIQRVLAFFLDSKNNTLVVEKALCTCAAITKEVEKGGDVIETMYMRLAEKVPQYNISRTTLAASRTYDIIIKGFLYRVFVIQIEPAESKSYGLFDVSKIAAEKTKSKHVSFDDEVEEESEEEYTMCKLAVFPMDKITAKVKKQSEHKLFHEQEKIDGKKDILSEPTLAALQEYYNQNQWLFGKKSTF